MKNNKSLFQRRNDCYYYLSRSYTLKTHQKDQEMTNGSLEEYSQALLYRHPLDVDTSFLQTVCFASGERKPLHFSLNSTCLIQTLSMAPSVSVLTVLDCIVVIVILRYIIVPNHIGPNFSPEIPDQQFFIQLDLHSTNANLSTTAIFFWWRVHTLNLVSTSLQWPLSSVPKVVVVEKFNCM